MSRILRVPDYGAGDSLYQQVEVAAPGEPGYPAPKLPEGDPWAPAVNRAIAEVAAEYAEYQAWAAAEADPEAGQ